MSIDIDQQLYNNNNNDDDDENNISYICNLYNKVKDNKDEILLNSTGSILNDNYCFNSNIVKSINDQVNSVTLFVEYSFKNQYKYNKNKNSDILRHRSKFNLIIHKSKQSIDNKKYYLYYPKEGSLLNNNQWNKLLNWNVKSSNEQWSLLYKATRDGFNDIYLDFSSDENAFLFSFSSNSSIKYSLIDPHTKYAIWNSSNYGPTFGRGADLFICSQSNIIEESYSKLSSSYRDPTGLKSKALAGQQHFLIHDIEIYY
ncbi:unnamed protein product [Adineta steineri]|uniref:TLDc domain-containing protein n=1 Tax=Adineta steineri TaxID=433720 RepID=A0A818TMV7_9BILA|nr:unnamed protein product [Adineta steineri]CAF3679813.1 unnamed protein product [Adineta steineri]